MRADGGSSRWDWVPEAGVIDGSPELIVETDSPSSDDPQAAHLLQLGALGVLDGVDRPGQATAEYWPGDSVPVPFTDGASIPVDSLFDAVA